MFGVERCWGSQCPNVDMCASREFSEVDHPLLLSLLLHVVVCGLLG